MCGGGTLYGVCVGCVVGFCGGGCEGACVGGRKLPSLRGAPGKETDVLPPVW